MLFIKCILKKKIIFFTSSNKAVSIIELVVILITLSLLLISILIGSNMLFSAKVHRVISQLMEYEKAVNIFYSTYNALPGDFKDTYIWADKDINNICHSNTSANLTTDFIAGNGDMKITGKEIEMVNCHFALSNIISSNRISSGIFKDYAYVLISDKSSASGLSIDENNFINLGNALYNPFKSNSIFIMNARDEKHYYSSVQGIKNTTLSSKLLKAIDVIMDDGSPGTGTIRFNNADYSISSASYCTYNFHGKMVCSAGKSIIVSDNGRKSIGRICDTVVDYSCDDNSKFINISSKNKNAAILFYLPNWLKDLS